MSHEDKRYSAGRTSISRYISFRKAKTMLVITNISHKILRAHKHGRHGANCSQCRIKVTGCPQSWVVEKKARKSIQVRIYQPTYRLNPKKRFDPERIQKILKRVVDAELVEIEYSEKVVPDLCLNLAEILRNAVKEENYDRYRIIVNVCIGQRRQQSVHIFHTFLWDHERDAFASYNYENPHIFANVVVYGVYLD